MSEVHSSMPDQMLFRVKKRSRRPMSNVAPAFVSKTFPWVTGRGPRFPPFSRGICAKSCAKSVLCRVGPYAGRAEEREGAWGMNEGNKGAESCAREKERGEGAIV